MATVNQQGIISAKATTNGVAKKSAPTTKDYVDTMLKKGEIAKALPSVMTPERFARITLSALSNNPKLAECSPQSFLGAMMQAAQLGLEPNTNLGQAYLIPYGNTVQFQIGYKGLIDLAYRSGEMQSISAHVVYENDEFDYEFGLNPTLTHKPAKSNRGKPIMYYATWKLKNGGFGFEVMSQEDVMEHAKKYSKTVNNGPWKTDFEAMALKTVLKKSLKYAPLKSDFVRGVSADESVKTTIDEDMSTVPNEFIDAEVTETVVDMNTGEVK